MKKLILITNLLVLGTLVPVYGQLSFNVSTGLNNSTCKVDNFISVDPSSRIGYFVGIAPVFKFHDKIQFQIDCQYSLKGYNPGNTIYLKGSEYSYTYLDIIPELNFYVLKPLSIGIGVNYGVKTDERFKVEGDSWLNAGVENTAVDFDYGLTAKLKFDYENMFVFMRYNWGLQDLTDLNIGLSYVEVVDADLRNRNLQIGIGYKLNVK